MCDSTTKDESSNSHLEESIPFLLKRKAKLIQRSRRPLTLTLKSPYHVPDVFAGGTIRTECWPRHTLDVVLLEVIIDDCPVTLLLLTNSGSPTFFEEYMS